MKPTASPIRTQGGYDGETIALTIDNNAMQHVMGILTNIYSDPEAAVIREYSTNALDSHVEAGVDKPIEVSTPNRMSPYFKVKDRGIGLDDEGLREVYSQYGNSTKRNTNSQVGMLGIGCKSGLTYTDQLLIESNKDGKKYNAVLSRDSSGAGNIQIVDIRPTDEPNGVEITIPVRDMYSFNAKVEKFFKFWNVGTVLVDGKQPTSFANMEKVEEGVYMNPNSSQDYVVMGNVPYEASVPIKTNRQYRYGFGVVVVVPVGSVDFEPSREKLMLTTRTEKALSEAGRRFDAALRAKIDADVAKAKTASAAVTKAYEWSNRIGLKGLTWNGKSIPFTWNLTDGTANTWSMSYSAAEHEGRKFTINTKVLLDTYSASLDSFEYRHVSPNPYGNLKNVAVSGFDLRKFTSLHVRKIRLYMEKAGLVFPPVDSTVGVFGENYNVYVARNSNIMDDGWLDDFVTHYKWGDIRAMKLPKAPKGQAKPQYHIHTKDKSEPQHIDSSKPLYYHERPMGYTALEHRTQVFAVLPKDAQVAVFSEKRRAKFLRLYPKAVRLSTALQQYADDYIKTLSKETLEKIAGETNYIGAHVSKLPVDRVLDPELAKAIRAATGSTQQYQQFRSTRDWLSNYRVSMKVANTAVASYSPERKYPLLAGLGYGTSTSAVLEYVNAVYTIRNGKGN